jgi:alpha-L-fucosidase
LLAVGGWLKRNGEAIYGTRPWTMFGEGPTETADGTFAESRAKPYTARDFRFTTRASFLYAIQLAEPDGAIVLTSLPSSRPVKAVTLLGHGEPLTFRQDGGGLTVFPPVGAPRQPASVYRITL